VIPRKIRKRFKKKKKYSLLSQTEDTTTADTDNSSVISKNYGKLKNLLKFKKKSKPKIIHPKISFNDVHEKFGQRIKNNHVTEDSSTTNSNF
jgi:hypothetical protein